MSKITPTQKKEYIEKPLTCPYCTSYDIKGSAYFSDRTGNVSQSITCNSCKKSWEDVYTLSYIKEYE